MSFSDSSSASGSGVPSGSTAQGPSSRHGPHVEPRTRPSEPSRVQSPAPGLRTPHILPSETSSLLHQLNDGSRGDHGTFTPSSRHSTGTDLHSVASEDESAGPGGPPQVMKQPSWRARLSKRIKSKKVRNSRVLAREAGVEYNKMM